MSKFVKIEVETNQPLREPALGAREARILDFAERAVVSLLVLFFLVRFLPTIAYRPYNLLLILGECMTAWFILSRRSGEALATVDVWIVAFIGSFAPLLARPGGDVLLNPVIGATMMIFGLAISIGAKGFLRRSFGIVAANRGVRVGGPYRLVRHPMYMGYLFTHIGFLSINFMVTNLLVYAMCWTAMGFRIRAEERILSQDPVYQEYQRKVRWRLMPGIW
jgi:protein-S-isoprenylcysteine O-methyltransferase Ste14